MVLPAIEEAVTWWQFTNSPPQDPEILARETFNLTGVIVPPEQCAELIFGEHDLILERTAGVLGMELAEFMREAQAGRIVWREHLAGGWVAAKRIEEEKWIPVPGVHTGAAINLRFAV